MSSTSTECTCHASHKHIDQSSHRSSCPPRVLVPKMHFSHVLFSDHVHAYSYHWWLFRVALAVGQVLGVKVSQAAQEGHALGQVSQPLLQLLMLLLQRPPFALAPNGQTLSDFTQEWIRGVGALGERHCMYLHHMNNAWCEQKVVHHNTAIYFGGRSSLMCILDIYCENLIWATQDTSIVLRVVILRWWAYVSESC